MENESKINWNLDQIGQDLQSEREIVESPAFGHGVSYRVGEKPTVVDIYPRANHVEVRNRKLLLSLNQVSLVGSDAEGGLFLAAEDPEGRAFLWVQRDGEFTFCDLRTPTLAEAVQAPARRERSPAAIPLIGSPPPPGPAETAAAPLTGPESPEIGPNPSVAEEPDEEVIPTGAAVKLEKQPKAEYLGRAGKKIIYKQRNDYRSPGSQMLVCEFMMHLADGSEKGQWIKVSAFRKDAERCQTELKAGGAVSLTGYKHVRRWVDQKGEEHSKEEIYSGYLKVL